jgi:hypothetical protein
MRSQVGVGLAAGILLCLAAISASATKSDGNGGGNAWGTQLAGVKSAADSSGTGNGHAWGLALAHIKGKRGHGEDAENQDDNDEGARHVLTSGSLGVLDMHTRGDHTGLRSPDQVGDDQGEDEGNGGNGGNGGIPTPPGGGVGTGVGSPPPVGPPPHDVAAVPEPSAALLFAAGTGMVVLALRRPRD